MGQRGFWDIEEREAKLAQRQDILIQLDQLIPWEEFRIFLEKVRQRERKSAAGRKPYDVILLFKMLVLQQMYNISDESLEYQINDRISFMRFLKLGIEDQVPDATTVWLFRQQLTAAGLIEELFAGFEGYLQQQGYAAQGGQILDATLIPVPKQRNRRRENEQIDQGKIPEDWEGQPQRLCQKDRDARWTKKNGASHFGYKDHINIDQGYGFIRRYVVTDAAVHDSQVLAGLLDDENEGNQIWADSAYRSKAIEEVLAVLDFESQIHERGYRNRPLSEVQNETNRNKSKIRAKVEHVFGHWVMEQGGKLIRCIGLQRAKAMLGLKNLTYNLKRFVFWESQLTTEC
jgi:transposase, IS5 family